MVILLVHHARSKLLFFIWKLYAVEGKTFHLKSITKTSRENVLLRISLSKDLGVRKPLHSEQCNCVLSQETVM